MNNSQLHVIFGTGPVGKSTARELVKLGKQVRLVNRSGHASDLPPGVEVVRGDAYNAASVAQLTAGAAVVYQAAQPEYHEWVEKFPPLQAAVLEGAAAAGARLVVVENLYAYGDTGGRPLTEDLPPAPHTRKGRVRAAMTESLLAAHRSGKVQIAIGRASNFFGPEYMLLADMIFYPALAGKTATALGTLDAPHSFTYVPDFGRALALLGTRDEALGQVWHVPNSPPISQRDLITRVFAQTGHPPRIRAANRLLMSLFGLFNAGARETVEMMYEWEKPFIVDSSRFERAFGLRATPIDDAIRQTVAWFRQQRQTSAPAA